MPPSLDFEFGPTQTEFILTDDHIVQLIGPMGEGKTFAGVAAAIAHAKRCGRDIEAALVRDTFQNIKTSTVKDIQEYLGSWAVFSDGMKRCVIRTKPKVSFDLFGIDDEASISKLQGPQYALIWLEEPAPIYEKANAGLPREVLNMSIARAARQRDTVVRVQITHNPSDEEHWTSLLAEEPDGEFARYEDPETKEVFVITKKTLYIRPGENRFLSGLTRAANVAAFKDDKAKYARYVEGRIATVQLGKKVTPGYGEKRHYSPTVLPTFKGEFIQMWDSWLNPSCIIAQFSPQNQLIAHDVCYAEGIGVKELLKEQVQILLRTPKYKDKVEAWRIIGDRSMGNPDQSSSRNSTAKLLEQTFSDSSQGRYVAFEPGPAHWSTMKEPLNECFKRGLDDGRPLVFLSRSAVRLHRALRGGWHYKTDNSGRVIGDKPFKQDEHSHVGDAFANGVAVLLPYDPAPKATKINKEKAMKMARSYSTGGAMRKSRMSLPGMMGV